jgi:outer membrane lipoprotein carrier protein
VIIELMIDSLKPMHPLLRLVLMGVGSLLAAGVQAGVGADRLQAFLDDIDTLSADFEQVLLDPDREEIQRSAGTVVIARPNRFRWDYELPYEQLIVTDGETFWIYDSELKQVTIRSLSTALSRTPAVVLSSDRPIGTDFTIAEQGTSRGLAWVELTPKAPDTDFETIRLGFRGPDLAAMELSDSFGQITLLTFSNLKRNPRLGAGLFRFEPPRGVDIIRADR